MNFDFLSSFLRDISANHDVASLGKSKISKLVISLFKLMVYQAIKHKLTGESTIHTQAVFSSEVEER